MDAEAITIDGLFFGRTRCLETTYVFVYTGVEMLTVRSYTLSIAAPAYNEADGLEKTIAEWQAYLREADFISEYEIVICNDGSLDQTGAILDRLARHDSHVRVLHLEKNQGAAEALSKAIAATRLDWVLLMDADGQFPVTYLAPMIKKVEEGATATIGIRRKKEDSLFTRFGSKASGMLCNLFFGTKYADFNSVFKLVPGNVLRSLVLEAKGLNSSTELTAKLLERGIDMAELSVIHQPRMHGKSSVRPLRDALHRLLFVLYIGNRQLLFKLRVLQRPSR